jgi:hypothetical protein
VTDWLPLGIGIIFEKKEIKTIIRFNEKFAYFVNN